MEAVLDKADETRVSAEERKNIYRLVGAHRGVSEALVDFAKQTVEINWAQWREERF
jgi:hypothetical protein